MAKKLDIKKLFLERGEIIGLALAGGVGVLLIAVTLFRPGRGLFSPGSGDMIKALKSPSDTAEAKLRDPDNQPTDGEKAPPEEEAKKKRIKPTLDALAAADFPQSPWVAHLEVDSLPRSEPKVFNIKEAAAAAETVPLQSYILRVAGNKMYVRVLKGEGDRAGGEGGDALGAAGGRLRGMMSPGGGGAGRGGRGMGGLAGMGMPPGGEGGPGGAGGLGFESKKKAKKASEIPLEKLQNEIMAEQVRPVRMAVIAGSFPLKDQVEEFRRKLRLPSEAAVLGELSAFVPPSGRTSQSFKFRGVKVQRRQLDRDGKPLEEWKDKKLQEDYAPYVIVTGQRFEEDDPQLEKVRFPGLAMRKLMQFRPENVGKGVVGTGAGGYGALYGGGSAPGMGEGGPGMGGKMMGGPPGMGGMMMGKKGKDENLPEDRYPKVESQLALLQKTLKELESKDVADLAATKSRFTSKGVDIFDDTDEGMDDPVPPGGLGKGGLPGEGGPGEGGDLTRQYELPEYCLVRVIDVTVEPGKTYEYRLKIVMSNPNYKRPDVASTEYSKAPTIESEWSTLPIKVEVHDDLRYYAVDQRKLDGSGSSAPLISELDERRQLVMQAHRFLSDVDLARGPTVPVGNWAVAERFAVYRGEYVGRRVRVELPVWKFDLEDYAIATDSTTAEKQGRRGIEVPFGLEAKGDQPEAILVDFDTGNHGYERVTQVDEDKVDTKMVRDQSHVEALLLMPDGKLVLRESAIDSDTSGGEGEDRNRRVKEARDRVKAIKEGAEKKPVMPGGGGVGSPG